MIKEPPLIENATHPNSVKTWHCGTLVYTKAGLISLFVFLLFGSFSFNLMMMVVPSILPLKLKSLGASDVLIGLLLTSVFPMFGMVISPYLSFKSDYLRTRWGRRKPFFFFTLPFVTLSILFLAFSEEIARFIQHTGFLANLSPAGAAVAVMGVCVVAFQFSDVVIASVYIYIFNDTVPVALTGRFFGLVQVVGQSIGFLYNFFIFKYAETHMREIFVGTAIVYFIGIGLLCLFVKEGEYPPVTGKEHDNSRGFSGFKTFFRESFSHKFYWTKFIYAMAPALSAAMWPFGIFFYKEMGLTLDYVGKAQGVLAVAGMIAAYFASIFIDRWHPIRILAYSAVFNAAFALGGWEWLFVTLPPAAYFWLNMLGGALVGVFHGALCSVASMPLDIRLQPKSRYGQFCSAQSMLSNGCKMLAGVAAGYFFWFLQNHFFPNSTYCYRFQFVWYNSVNLVMAFVICSLYRQWKALGGDLSFNPPAPWSEKGYEEMERPPFVGTQSRYLNYALNMLHVRALLSVVICAGVAFWLWNIGWVFEFKLYLLAILPTTIVLYGVWIAVERSLRADLARCLAGEPVKNGIPHHGILFLKSLIMLLSVPIGVATTYVVITHELHIAVIVFGIAGLISNLTISIAVLVLRRLERGYDPMIDYDSRNEELAQVNFPLVTSSDAL